MKSSLSMYIAAVTLFAALAVPLQLAAQESHDQKPKHHHYKVVDMGTFGGPASNGIPFLSNRRSDGWSIGSVRSISCEHESLW